ncbi:MAG: NAD-dependent epimerase/dehydratase family protein, partial [Candidatus Magasanikbacteria bacterium]|nr:NAD-dependent epimerase/dehydratase family protein [Candidatus Magasanikbacteria bacterium]
QDIVFHLAGIKGSPVLTRDKPASFFVPTIMFNTHVLDACMKNDIEWTLYTSTVGVYGPSEFLKEDDLWKAFPSKNDWFAGWAKRMGEIQLDAYRIERKKANFSIVRPVNVHGKFDNFNPETSMVIPSLIHKIINTKDKITLWGDGSPVRDFVSAYDVARAMIFCVEHEISEPLNIGSGVGYSIKELAEKIIRLSGSKVDIEWDTTKPNGDARRVADISKLLSYGFRLEKSLDESLKEVIDWYIVNKSNLQKRYDVFLK